MRRGEDGFAGSEGEMEISGKETTAREPRDIGCSGSEIVETRSVLMNQYGVYTTTKKVGAVTYHISPAHQSAPRRYSHHYHYHHSRIHCYYTTNEERMGPSIRGARGLCRTPSPHNIPVPPPVHFWPWMIFSGELVDRSC